MSARFKNIARVLRTHGSKGEVVVAAPHGLPFLLHEGMRVALTPPPRDRDRFVTVQRVVDDPAGGRVLFSFATSLHDAESIVGCQVLAACDDLELNLLDVPFDDLLDRTVHDVRFGDLGRIVEVMETPANDVWVVEGGDHGQVLIPVVEHVILDLPDEGPILTRVMDGLVDD